MIDCQIPVDQIIADAIEDGQFEYQASAIVIECLLEIEKNHHLKSTLMFTDRVKPVVSAVEKAN